MTLLCNHSLFNTTALKAIYRLPAYTCRWRHPRGTDSEWLDPRGQRENSSGSYEVPGAGLTVCFGAGKFGVAQ